MYFARQHTRMSLEEIGGYFGGRDHTTVMHAVSMVSARRGEEPDFAETLASLEAGFLPSQRLST
jgi:chromosomal replication initiator protein